MEKERKKELLKNGIYKNYIKQRKYNYYEGIATIYKDDNNKNVINYNAFNNINNDDIQDCERIRKAKHKQRNIINNHIEYLMKRQDYNLYFMTFTFNDEILKNTKQDTRKQKIRRLLNKITEDYILNIDYGKENEREHYHAVIAILKEKDNSYINEEKQTKNIIIDKQYKYGFYHMEKIRKENQDKTKLSNYITKLTLHSVKVIQSYVSVKKGSDYQKYKELRKKEKYLRHNKPPKYAKKIENILLKLDANQEKLENKEIEKIIKLFNYEIEIE